MVVTEIAIIQLIILITEIVIVIMIPMTRIVKSDNANDSNYCKKKIA